MFTGVITIFVGMFTGVITIFVGIFGAGPNPIGSNVGGGPNVIFVGIFGAGPNPIGSNVGGGPNVIFVGMFGSGPNVIFVGIIMLGTTIVILVGMFTGLITIFVGIKGAGPNVIFVGIFIGPITIFDGITTLGIIIETKNLEGISAGPKSKHGNTIGGICGMTDGTVILGIISGGMLGMVGTVMLNVGVVV